MISICIPCLNESEESLARVIENLTDGYNYSDLEIILWNDGSINSNGSFHPIDDRIIPWTNLTILDSQKRYGVGHGFDRCVEYAYGDIIVLMGADVWPERRKWLQYVKDMVKQQEIGCAVSVGLQPGNYDINAEGLYLRYGAKILYTLTVDDLPKNSVLRKDPDYRDILEAKWMPKQSDEPYEIECCYGAFYWLTKEFYQRIHGWDTIMGRQCVGHSQWGCLEPHLSLKTKVYGGKIMMYPDMRAGHVFARLDKDNPPRAFRNDLKWWNKLWVAHTLLDDELRDEVLVFPHPSLNLGQAQVMIRQNWKTVQETRQRNKKEGKLISKND